MAHELEMIDGQAQMAYRASAGVPWHGLGVAVSDDMTPEQMMQAAGLDWTVSKQDTFIEWKVDGKKTKVKTGQQALVRDSDGKIFDTVGAGWNPVQNKEAFDFFTDFVAKGDMMMDTAGSLKEGRLVWALASINKGFSLFGGDEVNGYLLFSNPHQYGKSIDVRFCATRVVCNNTITMALREKNTKGAVKINHRSVFDPERVKAILGISEQKLDNFKEAAEYLGGRQANVVDMNAYFKELFGGSEMEGKDLSRTAETVLGLVEEQPGANFAKGSWWQAFNAVTYATDHVLGRANDTRLESAWFGKNSGIKEKALALALDMAA